jgi:protein-S-isoprenylcysteine O-methyltransferase Ste14
MGSTGLPRLLPPHVALALLALGALMHFAVPASIRGDFRCLPCGATLAALGFATMIWAWWLFRRAGTTIRPADQPSHLVTAGPYRVSRNPMYLGIVAILLGIAVAVGSWPMLVAPAGFVATMSLVFIPFEERRLKSILGEAYDSYARRVRRWL